MHIIDFSFILSTMIFIFRSQYRKLANIIFIFFKYTCMNRLLLLYLYNLNFKCNLSFLTLCEVCDLIYSNQNRYNILANYDALYNTK